ncbi:hypothetical protein ABIA32_004620 [Streptacidiphilus sp. MAP12-20]|uniref:hypothetical protein n=1 Tax=Streptacidiphilus sp. MAP12-20 TaxID=3156299 RepID=UPI00351477C6
MSTDSVFGDSWLRVQRRRARAIRCEAAAEYTARWGWAVEHDGPSIRLLTGHGFDVLDVPEPAGCESLVRLERMGVRPGPVLAAHGRALFFVAPDTASRLPELLYRTGWDDADLDLLPHGPGSSVPAPPSPGARWLRPPTAESAIRPPDPKLLLGTLAYASHRGVPELIGRH